MDEAALNIVFLDRATIPEQVALPGFSFPHTLIEHDRTRPDQVAERICEADIVISNKVAINAEHLAGANRLRMIALAATGTDNIDLNECNRREIIVSNVRGYAVNSVPEHAMALIFALRRNLPAYHRSVAAGRWQQAAQFSYFDYPIRDLAGSTLGIVGRGSLGQAMAQLAGALGMRVQFAARKDSAELPSDYTSFTHMLRSSDIISLHCPLNAQTRGMIGAAEFALMERKPLLINTARGGLVDELALVEALRGGRISGAGFDAVSQEPPPADHPFMSLLELDNFILTPHIGWASLESVQTMVRQMTGNIEAFHRNDPRNVVAGFGAQ